MKYWFILVSLVLIPMHAYAAAEDWQAHDALSKQMRALEAKARMQQAALGVARENLAAKEAQRFAALRQAVAEADKAHAAAEAAPELAGARETMLATQAAREAKLKELLAKGPEYQAALVQREKLQAQSAGLEKRFGQLTADECLELAQLRADEAKLSKALAAGARAWWKRGEVIGLQKTADEAYKKYQALAGKDKKLAEAGAKAKVARAALAEAIAGLELSDKTGMELQQKYSVVLAESEKAHSAISELETRLLGGAKTVTITISGLDRRTRQEVPRELALWLPPGDYARGIIVAHPMIGKLATAPSLRLAAAREHLATMVYENFPGSGKESLAHLDTLFEKFAAKSGHPELRGAPIMLGGLSASVLGTRNVACAVPERVFGVIHAAGGNMQEMPDDGRGMVQVPFLAHNGEFEWCGPVGGVRPEYGRQTQWLMIREQMLRLWRNKYEHRMSLVVVPHGDHGAWDQELTALFVRKAAQYRLPKGKRDGSKPAVCPPLPVEKGWLTDADLDHPKHEPAPYEKYAGDKNNAFWHFDEEMARAVYEFHKGKFLLPDPTKEHPVPKEWPGK